MSKKELSFVIFACIFLGLLLWFMAEVMGGWTILLQTMGVMAVGFVIVGAFMLATIGIIYCLTIFRSKHYARYLREAGYAVYLHKHEIWRFAIMALMAMFLIPVAAWATKQVYGIHLCIQAGECLEPDEWYYIVLIIVGMLWLLGLISLVSTIVMWWKSFRPLRKYYNELQLGHLLDLPRLR